MERVRPTSPHIFIHFTLFGNYILYSTLIFPSSGNNSHTIPSLQRSGHNDVLVCVRSPYSPSVLSYLRYIIRNWAQIWHLYSRRRWQVDDNGHRCPLLPLSMRDHGKSVTHEDDLVWTRAFFPGALPLLGRPTTNAPNLRGFVTRGLMKLKRWRQVLLSGMEVLWIVSCAGYSRRFEAMIVFGSVNQMVRNGGYWLKNQSMTFRSEWASLTVLITGSPWRLLKIANITTNKILGYSLISHIICDKNFF